MLGALIVWLSYQDPFDCHRDKEANKDDAIFVRPPAIKENFPINNLFEFRVVWVLCLGISG